jgi:hypothetical protein
VKTCSKCGETKDRDQFYPRPKAKDGLRSDCKLCSAEVARKWQEANPDRHRNNAAKWKAANPEQGDITLRIGADTAIRQDENGEQSLVRWPVSS